MQRTIIVPDDVRVIRDNAVRFMLESGRSIRFVAAHFGISKGAVQRSVERSKKERA